jgi:glucose-6-phosphate 1-dehydrogenase
VAPDKRDDPDPHRVFWRRLDYVAVDARGTDGWADWLARMRPGVVRAFYFSVAPSLFGDLAERLHAMASPMMPESGSWWKSPSARSGQARALNATLARHFAKPRSTGSTIIWARKPSEPDGGALCQYPVRTAVECAVCRSCPDHRGRNRRRRRARAYYDKSGAMRDMVQNHMMQLCA